MSEELIIPIRNPSIRWRKEGMKAIVEPDMVLNEVGAFIWERCDGQHTIESIVREIYEAFDVQGEEDVSKDVRDFLLDLYANNLISWIKQGVSQ